MLILLGFLGYFYVDFTWFFKHKNINKKDSGKSAINLLQIKKPIKKDIGQRLWRVFLQ